ncbi:acetolactate synthase small subunit [Paenibacillus thailandensis]|uniref:Acetolactate synthase small subunit n=1 Tax=Paenibacillus thailandensis TaxID=393250 RepID=A0ABW5R206_9BACL
MSNKQPGALEASREAYIFSLLVQDSPGVLQRICALLTRRGINIASIAVGRSEESGLSRITLQTTPDGRASSLQIRHQLGKLIDVLAVEPLEAESCVRRELALIKLADTNEALLLIGPHQQQGTVTLLERNNGMLLLQAAAAPERLQALLEELRPLSPLRVVRSGILAECL